MNFLSETQLVSFYGKPIENISPTDTPLNEYVCGQDSIFCLECGEQLPVTCGNINSGSTHGFSEKAYCEQCEIAFSRKRQPVCTETKYQYHQYRTDEREEYVCDDCKEYHAISVPDSGWEYSTAPHLHSYEIISITCPCGQQVSIENQDIPIQIDCSSCSRKYTFSIE